MLGLIAASLFWLVINAMICFGALLTGVLRLLVVLRADTLLA